MLLANKKLFLHTSQNGEVSPPGVTPGVLSLLLSVSHAVGLEGAKVVPMHGTLTEEPQPCIKGGWKADRHRGDDHLGR